MTTAVDKWPACTKLLAVAPAGHIPPLLHHSSGHDQVFREKASGTQADRRQLLRLLKAVARGDVVIVTRIDRAARSLDL